jgi:predicted transcriptional regulator
MANLQDTFRVRVKKTFKRRFERVARLERRRPSDMGRDILENFVREREAAAAAQAAGVRS